MAEEIRDYRLINLIHNMGKLLSKGLAIWLAPFLNQLVQPNQSIFYQGPVHPRQFPHDSVYGQAVGRPSILLKIDLTKAFDTVNWAFLVDLL